MIWSPRNISSFIFFILFIISSIIELIFCFLQKEFLRKAAKPFPMLFLTVLVIIMAPTHWLLYSGTLCGLIGDIFLWGDRKRFFYTGSVFFFFGHLFYLSEILVNIAIPLNVHYVTYIILGVILIGLLIAFYNKFYSKLHNPIFSVMGVIYFFSLFGNSLISFVCAGYNSPYMLLSGFGSLIFLFSDIMVFKGRLIKKGQYDQFLIMPTYLLAQIMIVSGFLLTVLI